MRELHVQEINEVSGAGLFSSLGAAVLGGVMGITSGLYKGGVGGGNTGGIVGAGIIAALVGMCVGGIVYGVQGALYGLVNDWDTTLQVFNNYSEQFFDFSQNVPK
ncbi:hypothetical protein [Citrobacter rodentium]|jgi:hypothetical protein|uniref:Membrane protein n=2 Tax=Citrobacter rodentium TaxID=67825 RepID=D2TK21_CITRI|nr:hypothetical protein [Citrobacter rodentium]KIQ52713.1 hypothetical protein TA05_02990 [Citrobacter rodentium]QBY31599.1 hypothetical protein E2R62_24120 [Citrobacter rodentium]UHO31042.1 hypothetical protein K7R23_24520 [Citrobacter rodentium NBRC 105723 = DSM 16636]CBG87151.1 putative membrane protein [Citrobacter rodentium ICC168]HAT8013593.1 hypothetical protein [Citrobacter rodentium NBRC 105723 = DSM 16636]